jgi:ubiquinol-cytochrome c reductase cytochrome c1 subunit
MIRILAFVVGLFFSGWLVVTAIFGVVTYVSEPPVETAEHAFHKHARNVDFSFEGPLGKFDRAQLQRGFQVYKEVCSACHSINRVAFRDLAQIGYSEGQVKTIASEWTTEQPSVNGETGEVTTRKSLAADKFPLVYANDTAARAAQNGAIPPDLSLITKARHGGAEYVYSLLTGYQEPPAKLAKEFPGSMPGETTHYNPYFANLNLAMAAPIVAGDQVTYGEGAPKATKAQMAKDVSAFLMWTAEPKLETRHQTGIAVMIFLLIFAGLCYAAYRNVWAGIKH